MIITNYASRLESVAAAAVTGGPKEILHMYIISIFIESFLNMCIQRERERSMRDILDVTSHKDVVVLRLFPRVGGNQLAVCDVIVLV